MTSTDRPHFGSIDAAGHGVRPCSTSRKDQPDQLPAKDDGPGEMELEDEWKVPHLVFAKANKPWLSRGWANEVSDWGWGGRRAGPGMVA